MLSHSQLWIISRQTTCSILIVKCLSEYSARERDCRYETSKYFLMGNQISKQSLAEHENAASINFQANEEIMVIMLTCARFNFKDF